MTRKQIITAVSLAVFALVVAGLLWWRIGRPMGLARFQRVSINVPPPTISGQASPGEAGQIPRVGPTEEIVGIGAVLRPDQESGLLEVMNAIPDSPAERAGLTTGLLIQKVNDTPLGGLPLAESIQLIRGPVGTKVRLELVDLRQNLTNTIEVTREPIRLERGR